MINDENAQRISIVLDALGTLGQTVVFVGGATLSFYAERPVVDIRTTKDVDVLVQVLAYNNYAHLEDSIRQLGFRNDLESGIICRYRLNDILVDIMPTTGGALGFTNAWYEKGFENAIEVTIFNGKRIKLFTAPFFIASKFEAFKDRGNYEGRTSSDFEDIVFVLENRPSIWAEFNQAPDELSSYLKTEFLKLLAQPSHVEWIDAHVERFNPPATSLIIEKIKNFIS